MQYFRVKLIKYNNYFVNTVDTDSLLLWHQGISSLSVDYVSMCFHVFMG